MHNREVEDSVGNEQANVCSRIGGAAIGFVKTRVPHLVHGEPPEGFKQTIGTCILGAGAVVTMVSLDKVTGLGTNPLNYAWALHQMTTY